MDCLKLLESLDIFGFVGLCLSLERSQLLQNSLLILQNENHFQKCYYWGRINGIQNDYHIAYGFRKECLDGQIYYYSTDCLNWLLMPDPSKCAVLLTPLAISDFRGDSSITVNVYDRNLPYPPNEDLQRFEDALKTISFEKILKYSKVPIVKHLKEEDRLGATVYLINNDAAMIPRGAWFKTVEGKTIENLSFEGLEGNESMQLKSYLHARAPQNKWNTNLLTRKDYNFALDFLDTAEEDIPTGCWSLKFAQGGRLSLLHSLYWPGMTFYHKINTPHYGFLYVGDGKRNIDAPFML